MESGKIKIRKLETARRQLETAIRIYFADGDVVSIHTLAAASLEILRVLDKQRSNTGTIFDHVEQQIEPKFRREFVDALKKPQNFFKHANRDAKEDLEFNLDLPEIFLWEAATKYVELTEEKSLEFAAYRTWFIIQNPEVIKQEFRGPLDLPKVATHFRSYPRAKFFEFFSRLFLLSRLKQEVASRLGA